jgi:hydroxymethylbilane synthase
LQRQQLRRVRSLMTRAIVIGTRGSQLALWQANWVRCALTERFPDVRVELLVIKTTGDKILDVALAKVGGKGLFVKEIEEALLSGRIDVAVHSMKDMPADIPEGLWIGAVPERENPLDVLITRTGGPLAALPEGARVGTSSLRRGAQLRSRRPDLRICTLRGNLDTRLRKLAADNLDAIVLAAAGVHRLGLAERVSEYLPMEVMLPAVGQGALCIEVRREDPRVARLAAALDDPATRTVVTGERAFLKRLEGGCQVPIAAHGTLAGPVFSLTGLVAEVDGRTLIRQTHSGSAVAPENVGIQLAEHLLALGAKEILDKLKREGHNA